MRRSIAAAGVFLIMVGSIFLIFGMYYAWTYGVSADIPLWNLLFPEAGGDIFSLMSLSSSSIVLGIVFLLWALRLRNNQKTDATRKG